MSYGVYTSGYGYGDTWTDRELKRVRTEAATAKTDLTKAKADAAKVRVELVTTKAELEKATARATKAEEKLTKVRNAAQVGSQMIATVLSVGEMVRLFSPEHHNGEALETWKTFKKTLDAFAEEINK